MIPRIPVRLPIRLLQDGPHCQKLSSSIEHAATQLRPFTTTPPVATKLTRRQQRDRDSYSSKAKQARIAHNITLQATLRQQRAEAKGDPIRGAQETTSFVQSLKDAMDPEDMKGVGQPIKIDPDVDTQGYGPPQQRVARAKHLNHFLTPTELDEAFAFSKQLSRPYVPEDRSNADPATEVEAKKQHDVHHIIATQAISRIIAVENASAEQKKRINTQRIIDKFGRHNTDHVFESRKPEEGEPEARAGVDTGSSEVQIGLLTAKIQSLADRYQGRHKNDKHNKRNLRVLLHKRQKLLKYFYRKDRGGERWQHCISSLGLTPATWEGEIEVR